MTKTQATPTASIQVQKREKTGTREARYLRAEGKIPSALAAGDNKPHVDFAIDEHEFLATRRRHQHVYELELDGVRETALVRELQWDTYGEHITHVEFRRVDLTKTTEVDVAIAFIGHPKGQLNLMMTHVKVRALPIDIPDELEVSVADLEPGTNVAVSEIKLPKGIELITSPKLLVARISVIKIEVLETPVAAAPVEGAVAAAPAEGAAAGAAGAPAKGAPGAAAPGKGAPGAAAPAKGAPGAPAKGAPPAGEGKKPDKK
jgi:large subunit ribosomal protein L25